MMEVYVLVWRYSINEGEYGGIVYANSYESAMEKVKNKYKGYNDEEICVWRVIGDDYFDTENPDVWECYGD